MFLLLLLVININIFTCNLLYLILRPGTDRAAIWPLSECACVEPVAQAARIGHPQCILTNVSVSDTSFFGLYLKCETFHGFVKPISVRRKWRKTTEGKSFHPLSSCFLCKVKCSFIICNLSTTSNSTVWMKIQSNDLFLS